MFGVCYYPEHWPESDWHADAAMMADLGLTYVRIGEFAWSKLEPTPGEFNFEWFDKSIEILTAAGLKVIIGTPTATPPKWLIDKYPEVLPVDPHTGHQRGFGSRRHYDFSSERYLIEALRISKALAQRYGSHPGVAGWQTDNELCCHDTSLSGSASALAGFRDWCRRRYQTIDELNTQWGNIFWSMEYPNFDSIELPFQAVTETNPAHQLAFRRYSSDKVVEFHDRMVETIRAHVTDQFVTHNFIPMSDSGVDDWALAEPLDFGCYDSYPLGRTDGLMSDASANDYSKFMRTGHPDLTTYTHDQIRCLKNNRFWIMEQQPGPVNWAHNNARPAPGMIRFWTLEAFAHGAECVSYFRWRQVPFAQEQMHAGLLRVDRSTTETFEQVKQLTDEVRHIKVLEQERTPADIAIISSADAEWVSQIEQQGVAYEYEKVQFSFYCALRELGINIDFISRHDNFEPYKLIIAPSLPLIDEAFVERCQAATCRIVFGPRAGAKTDEFCVPPNLAPGHLQALLPVKVLSVETLRQDCADILNWAGKEYASVIWREELSAPELDVVARYANGEPAVVQGNNAIYMGTLSDNEFLRDFLRAQCKELGIDVREYGADVRTVQRGNLVFAFNYSLEERTLPLGDAVTMLVGERTLPAHGVSVWQE